LIQFAKSLDVEIAQAFEDLDFAKAHRLIFSLADEANKLINDAKPWILAKDSSKADELVLSQLDF
jgi:methionyl-tRNA synthetase